MKTDHIQEKELIPSKLPGWLAVFIQKWMALTGLIMIFVIILLLACDVNIGEAGLILILVGLGFIIVDIFLLRSGVGAPSRNFETFLKEDGEYDMETPRKYTPINKNWFHKFFTFFRKSRNIREFAYDDGKIQIITGNGKVFEAPLNETTFSYTLKEDDNGNLFTYTVAHGDRKIKFVKVESLLTDSEWEDIFNILIRGNFSIEKGEKQKWVNKALQITKNVLDGDVLGGIDSAFGSDSLKKNKEVDGMKILGNINK